MKVRSGMVPIILLSLLVILIILVLVSWILSSILIKPKVLTNDKLYEREIKTNRLDKKWFDELDKQEFIVPSRYGYNLSCMLLNNQQSKQQLNKPQGKIKLAILCHGYTSGKYGSMIYAKLFLKRGITVLTYDHRNHGLSGKAMTSMSYYEKFDLQTIIDWSFEHFGANLAIVTHGESMGAATVLSHLSIDGRIRCSISDCAFSDLKSLLAYQLKKFYHLPRFPFLPIANIIVRLRAKFWLKDVSPLKGAIQTNAPILFIHGIKDSYIPCWMSQNMYDAKLDKKELYLANEGGHAESCLYNPKEYEDRLNQFLDKYYFREVKKTY